MKTYTTEELDAAFEFIRIVNQRGGYRLSVKGGGEEEDVFYEFPDLTCLLKYPDNCEHLPLPTKKVMMQMWQRIDGTLFAEEISKSFGSRNKNKPKQPYKKVGEPYEFTYSEAVK